MIDLFVEMAHQNSNENTGNSIANFKGYFFNSSQINITGFSVVSTTFPQKKVHERLTVNKLTEKNQIANPLLYIYIFSLAF